MEPFELNWNKDTIAAISTPNGVGGIAVIRVSGPDAINLIDEAWKPNVLKETGSHTARYGHYFTVDGKELDEGIVIVYRAPNSFTGEDTVEINVHGSSWIQRELLNDLVKRGIRIAEPGEFTKRAFLNGKIDLAKAEGVADMISSSSKAAHDMAINLTKGLFSKELGTLRDRLIEFASLLELELDFSEEEVEFADRNRLIILCKEILTKIEKLAKSYSKGSVLKNGIPVVIAGVPNAGKSSLLNLLLNDDKAIVTDIPGTTRDIIEDTVEIEGILYRFSDTAGLRETEDKVEGIGVEKALSVMQKAFIIIWVVDLSQPIEEQIKNFNEFKKKNPDKNYITLLNKADISESSKVDSKDGIIFSTLTKEGVETLLQELNRIATEDANTEKDILVTNARHYEALIRAGESLKRAEEGLQNGISSELVAQDIRETISSLGTITGEITSDTILHSIFSRFCIGK